MEIVLLMKIETLPVGPYEVNCYILVGENRQAIIIDPGADAERIREVIAAEKLTVTACLVTHGHTDHVCALQAVVKATGCVVGMHPDDARWAFSPVNQLPPYYPVPGHPGEIARTFADGQEWTDGGLTYRIIATPGHSPGGVCIYFPEAKALFSGDTLFQGSVGRTDLRGGDARILTNSLRRLQELPNDTRVFPGHGDSTTIAEEKANNFFFRGRL